MIHVAKFKYYIKSARLRTLPLSLSGIIIGIALASKVGNVSFLTAILTCLTTVFLQILSNVSNELGDHLLGTDNEDRLGPQYSDGNLSIEQIKRMIGANVVLSAASGLAMIWSAFGSLFKIQSLMLIALGLCAIAAAIKYTLGKNPYGYRAKGDIYVFIFFGLVSVLGSYYVVSAGQIPSPLSLLPAAAIGFFSIGVLNINNIRDIVTDANTRVTTAIKFGEKKAKIYHIILLCAGWCCLIAYIFLAPFNAKSTVILAIIPLYALNARGVYTRTGRELDPMLPMLVMTTFFLSIIFAVVF